MYETESIYRVDEYRTERIKLLLEQIDNTDKNKRFKK
jgi:hypothetical protein